MRKVWICAASDYVVLQEEINNFIENRQVVDIKYQSVVFSDQFYNNGIPSHTVINDRAMVIYEE